MKSRISPLKLLERTDKWYLGGGNRLLWAPEFPVHLDKPGFWDHASYYNYSFEPLFTWAILDQDGRELLPRFKSRRWNPAVLVQQFVCENLEIEERKCVLPNDVALSTLILRNKSKKSRRLHLVIWTSHESKPSSQGTRIADLTIGSGASFIKHLAPPQRPELPVACSLGISRPVQSYGVLLSEGSANRPTWSHTPFAEAFKNRSLGNTKAVSGVYKDGLISIALHCSITIGPNKRESVSAACALAPSPAEASRNRELVLKQKEPQNLSILSWEDHFAGVPAFECSDEFFMKYYWYRWYGLRLNTMYGEEGNYSCPFVCEGIGYFRAPISYSAPCHMLENRWMHEPELARGSLLTFLENQRADGGFRGYIDVNYYRQDMFYHANWGRAVLQLDQIHPSKEFLEAAYKGLKNYASYFDRERDEEISGMYDIDNHYETGQEYMHRYIAVDPNADQDNWGEVFRLKGVDVTVYVYELKQALAVMAEKIGRTEEADLWTMEAERIKSVVRSSMWDPKDKMFYDIDPATKQRTKIKTAICFYPYFTDIVRDVHIAGLKRHLLNPREFWTRYPVPSSSADDKYFSAEPMWKGKRMNCPWNGRVWPMTNSHITEALATSALRFGDGELKKRTAEFLTKYVRMMFFDGDSSRPNCFEHYNPLTGTPSVYRGIDDYQHSWVNDLIIKYVCGIRPDPHTVTIDPFPFGLKSVQIDNVVIRGRQLKVEVRGKRFIVWLDGRQHVESVVGRPVAIQI